MPEKAETLVQEAERRLKLCWEAEALQREEEKSDLAFQVPELQWDPAAKAQRMGDGHHIPARPTLSISKIDQPLQLINNQAAEAQLGVRVHPISEDADEETAEVIQGIYRRIERDSEAQDARLWALDRAAKCGRGVYRVNTKYDEDSPETFDQEIVIERILHQESVYFDPAATKADMSDAEFAFVTAWIPMDTFRREYPNHRLSSATSLEWESFVGEAPNWARGGLERDAAVLVLEYWYKTHALEKVRVGEHERERDSITVYMCKIAGRDHLEEPQRWNGRHIPLVCVVGREIQPFDDRRRWVGMIRSAKDGQRLYNFAASSLVESMALEPKAPWVGAEGQFEGHEERWRLSNVRNVPYLEYRPVDVMGKPAPRPERAQVDGSRMNLSMMALQEAENFIQATTAVFDASLGKLPQRERSGRAIMALQQQSDAGTSHFLRNLARAIKYEARIVLDLMPTIYDRPGRITRILKGEIGEGEAVMLGQPFTTDPRTGRPVPHEGEGAKVYDLTKGRYSVSVDVGKSFQTRLQEGDQTLTEILSAKPELMPIIGDIWFQYRDHPGAKDIAKRLAKWREMQFPGLGDEEGVMPSPEAQQAKMQAMGAQLQQMQQQLQMAIQQIETDRAKQEAALIKTQMEIASKERIAAADNETKLAVEGIRTQLEALLALQLHAHERAKQHEEMAHETALAAATGRTFTATSERGRDGEREEGRDVSAGGSSERAQEDLPPQQEASE